MVQQKKSAGQEKIPCPSLRCSWYLLIEFFRSTVGKSRGEDLKRQLKDAYVCATTIEVALVEVVVVACILIRPYKGVEEFIIYVHHFTRKRVSKCCYSLCVV